jgi:hypothetical protein
MIGSPARRNYAFFKTLVASAASRFLFSAVFVDTYAPNGVSLIYCVRATLRCGAAVALYGPNGVDQSEDGHNGPAGDCRLVCSRKRFTRDYHLDDSACLNHA